MVLAGMIASELQNKYAEPQNKDSSYILLSYLCQQNIFPSVPAAITQFVYPEQFLKGSGCQKGC